MPNKIQKTTKPARFKSYQNDWCFEEIVLFERRTEFGLVFHNLYNSP